MAKRLDLGDAAQQNGPYLNFVKSSLNVGKNWLFAYASLVLLCK